jgi:hypothetical protein
MMLPFLLVSIELESNCSSVINFINVFEAPGEDPCTEIELRLVSVDNDA